MSSLSLMMSRKGFRPLARIWGVLTEPTVTHITRTLCFRSLARIWGVLTGTSTIVSHKLVCFRSLARFRGGANAAEFHYTAKKAKFPSPREV